jgi:large subunit ribosomal protein L25
MAQRLSLQVEPRDSLGRKVKRLRKTELLPANIYGKNVKSQAVQVKLKEFSQVFAKSGATQLVDLQIQGVKEAKPVLVHNVQVDPLTDLPIHAEFYQVDLKQKVTAQIPIVLVGKAPATDTGGVLVQILDEVEVEALPTDLPEKFEVDVSGLKAIGDVLTAQDLPVEKDKVEVKLENPQTVVVQIEEPAPEEEEAPPPPAEGEAVAEGEGAKAEGEEAKAGGEGEKKEGQQDQTGEKKSEKPTEK